MSKITVTTLFDERKIDAIFAPFDQCHRPGAAVGIAICGKPMYQRGFGLANLELPVVLSTTIRMRIASISKHIAALAYMLLCEDGKAGIDDPIGRYLPDLHAVTRNVTTRQLMGNISGLHDAFDISLQFSGVGQSVTSAELLSLYRHLGEVNAAPGTAWIYNNGGFLILSFVIERITGQTLEDFLRERIFEPLAMYATRLRRSDTDFVSNSAAAHRTTASGIYEKSNFFGTAWAGEGGVVSTVDDMLRWLAHMDAPVVGSAATWEVMKASQTLANGTSTGYGLGLHLGRYRGVRTLYHSGGGLGCSAHMLKVPNVGLDIVVMVNHDDVHAMMLADKVVDACLVGLEPLKDKSTDLSSVGVFRSPTTGRVIQLFAKDGRQIASIDGMDIPVEIDNDGMLWPAELFRDVRQSISLAGDRVNPSSIRLNDFGNIDDLMRQSPVERIDLNAIIGRYRSDAIGTRATISGTAHESRLEMVGRFGSTVYSLECLAQCIWRARSPCLSYMGGILSFAPDIATFRFYSSSNRMWGLTFQRDHGYMNG